MSQANVYISARALYGSAADRNVPRQLYVLVHKV